MTLAEHLRHDLGRWPPRGGLDVIASPRRVAPGWDGTVTAVRGVATPEAAVLSVAPPVRDAVAALGSDYALLDSPRWRSELVCALGRPEARFGSGVFRWAQQVPDLGEPGTWVAVADPRVPAWLRPFGGEALLAFDDDGAYGAGVGLKRHDDFGWEVSVATEPALRGRGLARGLVAQAARRVLAAGRAVTYLHASDNLASARVADSCGFPDRGWRVLGVWGDARQPTPG